MLQNPNYFKVKVIPSGDGRTLGEVLYSNSDLLLETLAKANQARGIGMKNGRIRDKVINQLDQVVYK